MALTPAHVLSEIFTRKITSKLRSLKVKAASVHAADLAGEILDEVPIEAFEPREPETEGIVFFHGETEEKRVSECQAALTRAHLNLADRAKPISLYLSTFGGDVYAALALASTITEVRRGGRKVHCHIQGSAMSMGSLLAQVCDRRTIEPYAWFMLHNLRHWVEEGLKTPDLKDEAAYAERLEDQTFALYSARTGKPPSYFRRKMHRRDWFLSPEEALSEGLIDAIKDTPDFPRLYRRKPGPKQP